MNHDDLRDATWRPVAEETRAAHLLAIEAAVGSAPAPRPAMARPRRRLAVAAMAAALFILPAGIAVAAEGALPGDALYSVKKITEQIRSLVDDDVVAEHRVEELEQLVAEAAPAEVIAESVERASVEVQRLEPESDLVPRFTIATDAVGDLPPPAGDVVADPPPTTDTTVSTTTVPTSDTTVPTTDTTTPPTTVAVTPDRTTTTTVIAPTTTLPPDVTTTRVVGVVKAGPTCPVQQFPPDPACEDRPVTGAVVVIATEDGKEVTRVETDPEGRFDVRLPVGDYVLIPQPYDGLLGTADRQTFVVGDAAVELLVGYDTGIR